MATSFYLDLNPVKSYATRENAIKAAQKRYPAATNPGSADLHFIVAQTPDGRWFPIFIGERSIRAGVHFNFNVVA